MTDSELALAKRRMLLGVPRDEGASVAVRELSPVSFSVTEIGPDHVRFRLVDDRGLSLDLVLNPVVAAALRDCIKASLSV
ncbi:hypothetical protein RM190_03575 [Paracoccus sp. CPCC 101403]|uniref:Uncharacterized protein n=2 Tax=Paracoccus broussonetiae TaxID=3075834 RepID=A0ABU3E9M9_9RHOB|nr:hypothetical protein [Paracoccus sp. CPCC 101403]MDT1060924.1 hypothetical protein [Paracoccus sp. CPCC 101403]